MGTIYVYNFLWKFCLYNYVFQKLDRAWYGNDEGYDETNNPFADMSEEYTKMKEEQLVKKSVKRISAQQRQINQVSVKKTMC